MSKDKIGECTEKCLKETTAKPVKNEDDKMQLFSMGKTKKPLSK